MLGDAFQAFYHRIRVNYYRRIARVVGTHKASLSATECFCLEILMLMDQPTMSAFAAFLGISLPNANYRLTSLLRKGYLEKHPSPRDKRESILVVTPKYANYYAAENPEIRILLERIEAEFSPGEVARLIEMIGRINGILDEISAKDIGEAT